MDFSLTDDQREIQALAREVARAEIEPNAAAWDREHRFPVELYGKLAELGLMGVCVPEELGGAGADFISYILVLEELSRADAGVGVTVAVHTSACTLPILAFGTEEQRDALRAAARARRDDRRLRAHRARGRLGRGVAPDGRGAGRRRLDDHRREAVDHERQLRGHVPALRPHRPGERRARAASRRSCSTPSTCA